MSKDAHAEFATRGELDELRSDTAHDIDRAAYRNDGAMVRLRGELDALTARVRRMETRWSELLKGLDIP